MAVKTIRSAQFQYFIPTGEQRTYRDGRVEDVLSIRHAFRGDKVNITRPEDIAAGEAAGAFEPEEVEQESPVAEPEPTDTGLDFSSHDALVFWIQREKPTVSAVVDAAEGDSDKAQLLLAAEEEASGGQPRKGVVTGLNDLIEEEE